MLKFYFVKKIIFTDTSKMVKFLMKNIKNKNILNHQLILRYSTINIIFYIITLKKSNIEIFIITALNVVIYRKVFDILHHEMIIYL